MALSKEFLWTPDLKVALELIGDTEIPMTVSFALVGATIREHGGEVTVVSHLDDRYEFKVVIRGEWTDCLCLRDETVSNAAAAAYLVAAQRVGMDPEHALDLILLGAI